MYTHGVCTNHEAALAANQKTLARVGSVSLQLKHDLLAAMMPNVPKFWRQACLLFEHPSPIVVRYWHSMLGAEFH